MLRTAFQLLKLLPRTSPFQSLRLPNPRSLARRSQHKWHLIPQQRMLPAATCCSGAGPALRPRLRHRHSLADGVDGEDLAHRHKHRHSHSQVSAVQSEDVWVPLALTLSFPARAKPVHQASVLVTAGPLHGAPKRAKAAHRLNKSRHSTMASNLVALSTCCNVFHA